MRAVFALNRFPRAPNLRAVEGDASRKVSAGVLTQDIRANPVIRMPRRRL
jgi:hypothetical protein